MFFTPFRSGSTTLLASSLFLGIQACSSVPDSAPKEYHLADAAIDRAESADADDVFPQTIDRDKVDFKQALSLYKQSQEKDSPEPTRQAVAKEGSEKAMMAQGLADKATDLYHQVEAWDQKIEEKEDAEKSAAELAALQSKVVIMEEQTRRQAEMDQNRNRFEANIKSPVMFFGSNQSSIQGKFDENVDSLALTLRNNPQLKVTLIGYADKTGAANRNNALAEERADKVAKVLRERG